MAGFRADNPKRPVGIIPLVPLVSHSSLRDKIWDILDQAITTYPKNFGIVNAARRAAHENKDFARAANLAMHAISIAPEQPIAYHHAIMAMIHNGQTDEGETLATAALEKFPDVIGVLRAAADLAKIRGDVTAISARWNKLLTLLPNDLKIQTEGAALRFAGLLQPAQDDDDDQPLGPVAVGMTEAERAEALRALGVADETAMRDLMLRFESLGRSCEFGLLQRRFGAEPLGLLRWNGIAPPSLVRALEQKFSGFNDEDNVYVTSKSGRMLNEYTVRDRAYGTAMHSHVYKEHVSEEKVLPQQRRRVLFLLRKLTEELEQGDKICVVLGPPPAPQYLNRLVRAIRGFGQCPILVVSAQTEPGQAGAVQDLGNGVLRGYLRYEGRDAPSSNGRREWNIDYDSWMKIIKTVSDLILVRSEIPATAP